MQNLYLAHHGIKGMKWGVRRTPEQLGYDTAASGGGGGGGVELDEEELKKLKERLEGMAGDNFSDDEINKLASGERVNHVSEARLKNGQVIQYREYYQRDGDAVVYHRDNIDKATGKPIGKAVHTTLDDVDGDTPFANISQTKQAQHKRDVDARIAEGKARKQKQDQHKLEVDRTISREKARQEHKQRMHRYEVDQKIEAAKKAREQKQRQHRRDVDQRIENAKRQAQTRHKLEVDVKVAGGKARQALDDAKHTVDDTLYRVRRKVGL